MAEVHVSPEAHADLLSIFAYLLEAEGLDTAEAVIEQLDTTIQSLCSLPDRGNYPPELLNEGITLFRELHCYPWRLFYRVVENQVWVLAVLDGRRNIASLLTERLVR